MSDIDEPSEFGEHTFTIPESPASIQAHQDAKQRLRDVVLAMTRPLKWILDSTITLDIEWLIHEKHRWETDAASDIDNILKPLIDAFTGPEGILIDDSQISSLGVSVHSTMSDTEKLIVRFRFDADHYLPKAGLCFVRIKGPMCYPVPGEVRGTAALPLWLAGLETALLARAGLEKLTGSYYPARYVLPPGFIHRSRLQKFPVLAPGELLKEVLGHQGGST
ncbi:RusA family crossover junction endodeoxyribonuclease [Myxococcus sp. MISCRS1]|uniref:RusA family crossover junction endodeoxyribonuclease n=1 Tax=Myxococcus sp. MISCRS1 TaxID=2996786 RepID=UPI00226D837E|nr:RusA family crossover junction endodeoxyribonuclease [Myxococcus sp. MISCRS1]MCY0998326.1 RusA family crossover junction endodeoxyribonuclease [Myxococcus sp. MISCRS1]